MISLRSHGSTRKTEEFLARMKRLDLTSILSSYGVQGVNALRQATPVDTTLTASSWTYDIIRQKGLQTVAWHNTNTATGVNVAVILQYGHGTGTGGWVEGRDYINPVIRPLFDDLADAVWREVTNG